MAKASLIKRAKDVSEVTDEVGRALDSAYVKGAMDRAKEDEIAERTLRNMQQQQKNPGFRERLRAWFEKDAERRHEWDMKNHTVSESSHIYFDEIGVLKFTTILVAELTVFFAIFGVIMIAKWLVVGA